MSGPLSANDAFQAATSALKDAPNAAREVVIVSDFQEADWKAIADGAALPALDTLSKQEPKPQITFYRSRQRSRGEPQHRQRRHLRARRRRVAAHRTSCAHQEPRQTPLAGCGRASGSRRRAPAHRARLARSGGRGRSLLHARLRQGGRSFPLRPPRRRQLHADDNAFHSIVQVRNQLNVLLIDGNPGAEPLERRHRLPRDRPHAAHRRREHAQGPHPHQEGRPAQTARRRSPPAGGHHHGRRAAPARPRHPTSTASSKTAAACSSSRAPNAIIDWYNREFYRKGEGPYPSAIKGQARADSDSLPARILMQRFTHPARFTSMTPVAAACRTPNSATGSSSRRRDDQTQRIFNLDRNVPLMVEKKHGRAASSPSPPPPMPNGAISRCSPSSCRSCSASPPTSPPRAAPPRGSLSAPRIRLPLNPRNSALNSPCVIPRPDPDVQSHQRRRRRLRAKPPITQPGIFQLQNAGADKTTLLAFNIDGTESISNPCPSPIIQKIAQRHDAAFADTLPAYQALDRTRRHGSELWQPLLIALLGLLFFEVLLQQRIAKG
jgi:hypothetical protein